MIYTVTFNPAIDYVVHTDAMQVGMVNRSHGEEIYYGGKGINVSVILKELGIPSRALGFVAGFTGAAIEKGVQEMGIATDFVHLESGFSRINVKIKSGEETELNGQGPVIDDAAVKALFRKLDDLQDGDTIILAGSIPNTMPSDIYEKILAYLDGRQIRTVVDATNDLLKNVLKYKPFLIKPNNFELGELFGITLHSREEIAAYAGDGRTERAGLYGRGRRTAAGGKRKLPQLRRVQRHSEKLRGRRGFHACRIPCRTGAGRCGICAETGDGCRRSDNVLGGTGETGRDRPTFAATRGCLKNVRIFQKSTNVKKL